MRIQPVNDVQAFIKRLAIDKQAGDLLHAADFDQRFPVFFILMNIVKYDIGSSALFDRIQHS